MKIWLDDVREAPEGWLWIKNCTELTAVLGFSDQLGTPIDEISLDHDLGPEEKNGTGVIALTQLERFFTFVNLPLPTIHIHTMNPVARVRMQQLLDSIISHHSNC